MSQAAARADNTTIAASPSTSPQSQLKGLSGAVKTVNPQGDTARFVLADIKGKDAAVAFRSHVIRTAILELLKGNPRNLKEAAALIADMGAGVKAKAYAAGFAVVADVVALGATGLPVGSKRADGSTEPARVGKWMDGSNADLRTIADTLADAFALQFVSAYAAVVDGTKAKAAATRAANKAAKEAAAPAAPAADSDTGADDSGADAGSVNMELSIGDVVDSVVNAIQQGMLSAEELVLIRAALAGIEEPADMSVIASMGASNPLLTMQAH